MESEVDLLRRGYAAFSGRDLDTLLALCDPEIRLTPYIARLDGKSYEGHDGLRKYTKDAWDALHVFDMELESADACAGDWLLAKGTFCLRGHEADPTVVTNWVQLVKFRDGKLLEWRTFATEEEARAAAAAA